MIVALQILALMYACLTLSSYAFRKKVAVSEHQYRGASYATRYWDCCKAHCSWTSNTHGKTNSLPTCDKDDAKQNDESIASACVTPAANSAFTCFDNVPWAVNENLAYGYAAVPAQGDVCGKCYELTFTGSGKYGANAGAAALQGKKMIVQATNIGYDVAHEQFDVMIPGGGVGAFDACSFQWGVSKDQLGAQYGGFMSACQTQHGYNAPHQTYKDCVLGKCNSVFGSAKLAKLKAGCKFFVDWYQVADNPTLTFREVACPANLTITSGMSRSGAVSPTPTPVPRPSPRPTPTPIPTSGNCTTSGNCGCSWASADSCGTDDGSACNQECCCPFRGGSTPVSPTPTPVVDPVPDPVPTTPTAGAGCCYGPPGAACDAMWNCNKDTWCSQSEANCKTCSGNYCP